MSSGHFCHQEEQTGQWALSKVGPGSDDSSAGGTRPLLTAPVVPTAQLWQECRPSLAQCICSCSCVHPYLAMPPVPASPTRLPAAGCGFIRVHVAQRPRRWLGPGSVSLPRDFSAGLSRPMAMPRPYVCVSSLGGGVCLQRACQLAARVGPHFQVKSCCPGLSAQILSGQWWPWNVRTNGPTPQLGLGVAARDPPSPRP